MYQADGSYLGQQHGIWGLLRAYDGKGGKQPGLDFLPNNPTGSGPALPPGYCPAGSNNVSFEVHALTADQLPGKQIPYNSRFGLFNSNALVYVEKSMLADVKAGKAPLEPLVLRVSAGDCVHVKVVNDFKPAAGNFPGPQPAFGVLGPPGQVWGDIPIFNYNISLKTSQQVGLHPQLVAYDVTKSNGFNIGLNPD